MLGESWWVGDATVLLRVVKRVAYSCFLGFQIRHVCLLIKRLVAYLVAHLLQASVVSFLLSFLANRLLRRA